jgi:hypothetical protein
VVLESPKSSQDNQKHVKEEVMLTYSVHNSTGSEKEAVKSKRVRKEGADSESSKRILNINAKDRTSKLPNKSDPLDVVCTRGQKWLVEEL